MPLEGGYFPRGPRTWLTVAHLPSRDRDAGSIIAALFLRLLTQP